MAGIIYSKSAGLNDAKLGKILTPLRVVIEHESDLAKKEDSVLSTLYNVETSNRYAETIQYQDEFGRFTHTKEGGRAENDSLAETFRKAVEHIAFSKEFSITKEMLDDGNGSLTPDMKRAAQLFTRAYYETRTALAVEALANAAANKQTFVFERASVDLTCADKLPLFHKKHLYGSDQSHGRGTQSNALYSKRPADMDISVEEVVEMLEAGSMQIRNMKNENGKVMGYTADTVVIPGNMRKFERAVKQALGSEYNPADSTNAINVQCGNWNLVVLPLWQAAVTEKQKYPMLIMSSAANKALCGNMFFNRIPLSIEDYIDHSTRNWNINGYCRFGIGFPTYKHIVRVESVDSTATVSDADAI